MEILDMPINNIVPYENNPRKNGPAVEKVMKSIHEFGFQVPIVVDKDNVILAGHTRLMAAKELGMKSVPVIVAKDLDEARAKAYRLADNKVSEFSTWDFDKLEEELAGLACLDTLDMKDFGFSDSFMADGDLDDFFEPHDPEKASEDAEKKHTVICPHCGMEFEP